MPRGIACAPEDNLLFDISQLEVVCHGNILICDNPASIITKERRMATNFNMQNLPFSVLTEQEQETLLGSIKCLEFAPGDALIEAGSAPDGIFVVHSGK